MIIIGERSLNLTSKNYLERNPKKSLFIIVVFIILIIEILGQVAFLLIKKDFFISKKNMQLSEFTPYGLVRYKKNIVIPLKNYPSSLSTDKHGAISSPQNITKDTYIIVMLGGSTMEGRGASSDSKTISSILEKLLNNDSKIDVQIKITKHNGLGVSELAEQYKCLS